MREMKLLYLNHHSEGEGLLSFSPPGSIAENHGAVSMKTPESRRIKHRHSPFQVARLPALLSMVLVGWVVPDKAMWCLRGSQLSVLMHFSSSVEGTTYSKSRPGICVEVVQERNGAARGRNGHHSQQWTKYNLRLKTAWSSFAYTNELMTLRRLNVRWRMSEQKYYIFLLINSWFIRRAKLPPWTKILPHIHPISQQAYVCHTFNLVGMFGNCHDTFCIATADALYAWIIPLSSLSFQWNYQPP